MLSLPAAAGEAERPPFVLDPSTGEIDGRKALVLYPARYEHHRFAEYLDPSGCDAHLFPLDDTDTELVFPCGTWFRPPGPRRYRIWLEDGWRMSPYALRLVYAGGRFEGRGMVGALPLAAAGRLTLPADTGVSSDLVLRLWHAGPHLEGDLPREQLWRQRASTEVGAGLLMPEGPAIGALWDRRRQRYTAIGRPVTVRARATVELDLQRPRDGADLLVRLERATRARSVDEYDVRPVLVREGQELPPDVQVPSIRTVYAVWYGLAPGPAELRADSRRDGLPPRLLDLQPGRVEHLSAELKPRPALDVDLQLPAAVDDEEGEALVLELRRLPEGEVVVREELSPGARFHRFPRLPLAELAVALTTEIGAFTGTVDLTSGEDGYLLLAPPLIVLSGTVYLADEGHAGTLTFTTVGRDSVRARAGDDGGYEVVLPAPLRQVSIDLADRLGAPYVEFFPSAIGETGELDFRLSAAEVRVKVSDARTGEGVAGASVAVRSSFAGRDQEGESSDASRLGSAVSQVTETDAEGVALLPPPRPGRLEIRASAEGYYEMVEAVEAVVDGSSDQTIPITLEPTGESVRLRLVLPGGAPAVGAEVALADSLATGRQLFRARADADGMVELPAGAEAGVLLARHPAAAFLVREWRRPAGDYEEWALPAASPQPLRIRILGDEGDEVVPRGELALWVNGRRLSGRVLAWLTLKRPAADLSGSWSAGNVPPGDLAVLAWTTRLREEAYRGGLDALAAPVRFPWPEVVEVRAVQ